MVRFMTLPLVFILAFAPLAQADCVGTLSWKDKYRRASRIFTILSLAMLPVADTPVTMDSPSVDQVQAWQSEPVETLVLKEYLRHERARARACAAVPKDEVKATNLRLEMERIKQDFPDYFAGPDSSPPCNLLPGSGCGCP